MSLLRRYSRSKTRRHLPLKHLVFALFLLLWIWFVFVAEKSVYNHTVKRCTKMVRSSSDEIEYFVLLISDPQLTSPYSYNNAFARLFEPLVLRLSDIYMLRYFKSLLGVSEIEWSAVIFLGDLYDGATYNMYREKQRAIFTDQEFLEMEKRWNRIFHIQEKSVPYYYIAGNHDIGYNLPHSIREDQLLLSNYFQSVFGPLNFNFSIGGVKFYAISSCTLLQDSSHVKLYKETMNFLNGLGDHIKVVDGNSRVLLSHIPLFRPPETLCGEVNPHNYVEYGRGYSYETLLPQSLSEVLVEKIKPSVVISGDIHEPCKISRNGYEDYVLNTFSWLQGNIFPGFSVLTISDNKKVEVHYCQMHSQLLLFLSFVGFVIGTFLTFYCMESSLQKSLAISVKIWTLSLCWFVFVNSLF